MPVHKVHFEGEEEWDCKTIGECLKAFGESLIDKGKITVTKNEERILIEPDNSSRFILRFETMPRGEESLKIEVMWRRHKRDRDFDTDWSIEK